MSKGKNHELSARDITLLKNKRLIRQYGYFCNHAYDGLGQDCIISMLRKLAGNGDEIAGFYHDVLDIEITNIKAKNDKLDYDRRNSLYCKKKRKLKCLLNKIAEYNRNHPGNEIIYGKQQCSGYSTRGILYFELPGMRQMSFHTNTSMKFFKDAPQYTKDWDGLENSTLPKIEKAVKTRYPEELEKLHMQRELRRLMKLEEKQNTEINRNDCSD